MAGGYKEIGEPMQEQKVFIGSSKLASTAVTNFANVLKRTLPANFEIVPWWETKEWGNLQPILDGLERAVRAYDYAIFFCWPDDLVTLNARRFWQTRDNVVIEFGLFLSVLGKSRTFLVTP